jgi:hypothetical protein
MRGAAGLACGDLKEDAANNAFGRSDAIALAVLLAAGMPTVTPSSQEAAMLAASFKILGPD